MEKRLNQGEIVLRDHFDRAARFWWLLVLAVLLGAAGGYAFHRVRQPVYEAWATFYVSVDLTQVGELPLPLHDEDIALAATHGVLISKEVLEKVIASAASQGIYLDLAQLQRDHTVERKNAFWELRFRSEDPTVAQTVTNLWAQTGYQTMLVWQETGIVVPYVVFNPPTLAVLPQNPVLYGRSQLILAGCLLGFVAGIFLVELVVPYFANEG